MLGKKTSDKRNLGVPAEWTDAVLLDQVLKPSKRGSKQGNERGWTEFIRRYRSLIYRCITKVTSRHAPRMGSVDLDEIFAEVLLTLIRNDMRKLRLYDPTRGTKLSSWVGMITINCAYDHLRALGRRPSLDRIDGIVDPGDDVERSPLEVLMEKERWDSLNNLLSSFSERDRTFLELYYRDGMDPIKVAEAMKISLKTVYSKKHKIRASLHRRVSEVVSSSPISDLIRAPRLAIAA